LFFLSPMFAFPWTECLKIFPIDDLGFGRKYRMHSVRNMYRMRALGDFRFPERCCWVCESLYFVKQSLATSIRSVKYSVTSQKTRVLPDPCLLTGYIKTLRNNAPLYNCELVRSKLTFHDTLLVGPVDCWCPANGVSVFTDCGPHYVLVIFWRTVNFSWSIHSKFNNFNSYQFLWAKSLCIVAH
jgi:hypothetical protein